jgi:hypothetical protein
MARLLLLLAGAATALAVNVGVAVAGPLSASQILSCEPNRGDVADVAVNNLRFGLEATYAWANATIHLTMRNGTAREYFVSGRADPIDKQPRPNTASAGFTYPGFTCTVQFRSIVSVRNCNGMNKRRYCEIGVSVFGMPMVYGVSMTAERQTKLIEASAP